MNILIKWKAHQQSFIANPRYVVQHKQSINPINNLIYGYGGIKLLPRKLVLEIDKNTNDMTKNPPEATPNGLKKTGFLIQFMKKRNLKKD